MFCRQIKRPVADIKRLGKRKKVHHADYIEILSVQHDGPGFWSSFGALPLREPSNLNEKIEQVLEEKGKELSSDVCDNLAAISQVARENPYLGWRMLSLTDYKGIDNTRL